MGTKYQEKMVADADEKEVWDPETGTETRPGPFDELRPESAVGRLACTSSAPLG